MISLEFERGLWEDGLTLIAGVDESGRGPLAGPVVSAAVIFKPSFHIDGVRDSKKLSPQKRDKLFDVILREAVGVGVGIVSHDVIDSVNILNATFQSMHQAIGGLKYRPEHLLIDGPYFAGANIPFSAIIGGDSRCFSIAAASIIAKVTRDRLMEKYNEQFPQYGFAKHKGYGTRDHMDAIRKHGLCEIHRRSFRLPAQIPE